jgi:NSS family neurotransmitter:Na+ symporter
MRENWSQIGFLLVAIGYSVGLGNIWRFPYIVGQSGGGAFLIPYFIAVLFIGIPILLLELAAGRNFRGSVFTTFKRINPKIRYIALIVISVELGILSYYLVVTGWTFAYLGFSLLGEYPSFDVFSKTSSTLFCFLGILFLVAVIASLGVKKGIEKFCKILLPLLFVFLLVLVIKALSLPGAKEGVKFFLSPNFSSLLDLRVWALAFTQAIFSLGAGYGGLLTYGSYLSEKEKIPHAGFIIAGADTLIALLAGLIVFPIVFSFGLNPAQGVELAFVSFPQIFTGMAGGYFFGIIFFFLLFIGAMSTAIGMLELGIANLVDERKWTRIKSAILISIIMLLLGLPSALSYSGFDITLFGKPFLDSMDIIFGCLLAPICALSLCLVISWFWNPRLLMEEINKNSRIKIPFAMIYLLRYVIPFVLFIIFILALKELF